MPRKTEPLSDLAIRNAKPQARRSKLFDGTGLHLLITPSGATVAAEIDRFLGAWPEVSLAVRGLAIPANPVATAYNCAT